MRREKVQVFTEKERELVRLLINAGTGKNIAIALVYLANTRETTSRAIERGTDLRQPEVSMAMKSLKKRGWIKMRQIPADKGRPTKVYELAVPLPGILDDIWREKVDILKTQLALIQKMKEYL